MQENAPKHYPGAEEDELRHVPVTPEVWFRTACFPPGEPAGKLQLLRNEHPVLREVQEFILNYDESGLEDDVRILLDSFTV